MIKKIKNQLVTSIKNRRLNVFLLFLVSSFLILIFSKLSKEYTNTVVFNTKRVNVPQDKVILNDASHQLRITLKTHGFRWLKYYITNPEVTIDFDRDVYRQREEYVYVKSPSFLNEMKQFQDQVRILDISPDTLFFKFDTNLVKKVPVLVDVDVTYAPGFDILNNYKVSPDSVIVIGPHKIVEKFDVLHTKKTILKDVKSNIKEQVELILPENNNDLKFSQKFVEVTAEVEKFTEGTLDIPIKVINLPQSLSLKFFPKKLRVSYYTSLGHFNEISAKDFRVICDFKKVTRGESFMIPELVQSPKNVKYAKLSQQHIEFIISK